MWRRAIEGQFRRTIGENIDVHERTLPETERTMVETDARSRLLNAHYARLTAECQVIVKTTEFTGRGRNRNAEELDRVPLLDCGAAGHGCLAR